MSAIVSQERGGKLARPVAAVRGSAVGFAAGFRCLLRGLRFVYIEHRELKRFYLPPMLLGLLIMIGGWLFFAYSVDAIVSWVWPEPSVDDWWGIKHFLWSVVHAVAWLILAAASLVTSFLVFMLAAAPFNDLISERVEGILGTWEARPFDLRFLLKDLGHTVLLELARLGVKAAWLLPLFVIGQLIPVVGQAVYIGFGGYLLAKFLGMDYVDWSLARRGYAWRERFRFAKAHRWAIVGFGTAVVLALMIPFGFVLFWPGFVAGGTILAVSLEPEDRRAVSAGAAIVVAASAQTEERRPR